MSITADPRDQSRSMPVAAEPRRAHVVTDPFGEILHMDTAATRLLNISARSKGRSFLVFIAERRPEFIKLARSVPSAGIPPISTIVKPRDGRAVPVTVELRQHPEGVQWIIVWHAPAARSHESTDV